jgi:hypothetical protein
MDGDGVVCITTRSELNGTGIESRWGGEIFRTRPDRPWCPPSLQWVPDIFTGGKAAGSLTTHPYLKPRLKKP